MAFFSRSSPLEQVVQRDIDSTVQRNMLECRSVDLHLFLAGS